MQPPHDRVAAYGRSKLANLKKRKDWLGSDEELTKSTWLESDGYKEWMEEWKDSEWTKFSKEKEAADMAGEMKSLISDSQYRKRCVGRLYEKAMSSRRSRRRIEGGIGIKTVASWVETWPIMNECTHFSCVMDPKEGKIAWVKSFLEPPEPED